MRKRTLLIPGTAAAAVSRSANRCFGTMSLRGPGPGPGPPRQRDAMEVKVKVKQGRVGQGRAECERDERQPAPRIDVLPQQSDFRHARRHERCDLRQHRVLAATLLHAPCIRHHAIRAALVAAVDDVDKSRHEAVPQGRDGVLRLVGGVHGHDLVAFRRSLQQVLQSEAAKADFTRREHTAAAAAAVTAHSPVGVLRSHDDVHLGKAPGDVVALLLSHAAGHDDGHLLTSPLALRVRAKVRIHLRDTERSGQVRSGECGYIYLLLGMVSNGTGVQDHQVRLGAGERRRSRRVVRVALVAQCSQLSLHALAVRHVHLATHRFQGVGPDSWCTC